MYQEMIADDLIPFINPSHPYNNSVDKIEPNLSSMTVELNQKIENQIFKLNEKKSGKLSKIGKVDCTQMLK